MPSPRISAFLQGNDRRSIGRSNEVVKLLQREPRRFAELLRCLWSDDAVVRMRAADAAEKLSAIHPHLLQRHKAEILGLLAEAEQIELRWHLAQMVPRLILTAAERGRAAETFERYLQDRSSIVRTFALQALTDISQGQARMGKRVRELLENSLRTGTAAMKARARKLLRKLQN